MCDKIGAISKGRTDLTAEKQEIASTTNKSNKQGDLSYIMKGSDVFIGVSAPMLLQKKWYNQ